MSPTTSDPRDIQIENLKREVETLRAELEKIKMEVRGRDQGRSPPSGPGLHGLLPALQAQRYISQLKGQVNALEAELEEQRKQKQKALVDNEQLRHELAQLKAMQLEGARNQSLREEAESAHLCGGSCSRMRVDSVPPARLTQPCLSAGKVSATEARYSKLKEKHNELINTHAELLRKVGTSLRKGSVARGPESEPVPCLPECRHSQAADGDTAESGRGGASEGAAGLPDGASEA